MCRSGARGDLEAAARITFRSMLESITSRLPVARVADNVWAIGVLTQAGLVRPMRPDKAVRIGEKFVRWGVTPALATAAAAVSRPSETALVDEMGTITYEDLHRRSNALARALQDEGVREGDGIAIMCRNHRHFVDATLACSKLGAVGLYLNTAFAGPQLAE